MSGQDWTNVITVICDVFTGVWELMTAYIPFIPRVVLIAFLAPLILVCAVLIYGLGIVLSSFKH